MGGSGSGRWGPRSEARTCAEDCTRLDVRQVLRGAAGRPARWDGTVTWGTNAVGVTVDTAGRSFVLAYFTQGATCRDAFGLVSTTGNGRGVRWWAVCGCGRRAGVLYLRGGRFACRWCHGLTYRSRQETRPRGAIAEIFRTLTEADRLLKKLTRKRRRGRAAPPRG